MQASCISHIRSKRMPWNESAVSLEIKYLRKPGFPCGVLHNRLCSRLRWTSRCALNSAAIDPEPLKTFQLNDQDQLCQATGNASVTGRWSSGGVDLPTTARPTKHDHAVAAAGMLRPGISSSKIVHPKIAARPGRHKGTAARLGAGGRTWTKLHSKLQHSLASSNLLDSQSVLVAVSGGQDSICLLQALMDLQPLWGWRLGVVHCDHGWRADSGANADFVRELAERRFGLPCYVQAAAPGTVPNEHSAREWRYRVFAEVATTNGYELVVTGHTATDRAETMLLNLLRGSGPDGLVALAKSRPLVSPNTTSLLSQQVNGGSGLSGCNRHVAIPSTSDDSDLGRSPPRDVRVVRPLLEFSRSETQEFVELLGLPFFHDITNDCNDLRRNRLRNQVMPVLRQGFNPRLDQALFRFVEVLSAEMEYLAHLTDELYSRVISHSCEVVVQGTDGGHSAQYYGSDSWRAHGTGGSIESGKATSSSRKRSGVLKLDELRQLPLAMQRRVVRKWLEAAMSEGLHSGARGYGDGGGHVQGQESRSGNGRSGAAPSAVRYDDVARCLALLHAPNRTNSDSLCGGMVACVCNGQLVLSMPGCGIAESDGTSLHCQRQ
ncbi:hypothetical protein VaNZ11_004678 [Volvox africanus]|uniref:tRNA(Ile)-lysidine synthetase n=1 Tax=Volvox africanus TaxID=51714 RepID=A0ABQ5RWZ2_9CHLO|nr:hypothetical protein VaNZ11_004678 [Volvox africanus]